MIGHGRSDIYNEHDFNFKHEEYAKMIIALLDFLELEKVNAIGASSGGLTLHHLNVMQPDRFKSVITIGGHIYFSVESREIIKQTGMNAFMKQYSTWDASFYIYMDCLFITSESRGMGIGEKLINRIKEEGRKEGCYIVQWQTPTFNKRAMKFYDRIGALAKSKERYFLDI